MFDRWLPPRGLPRATAAVWVLAGAAALAYTAHRRWVCDDIFITYRYCDNLIAGLGPVYNPGERSEGYTHFLWFLLSYLGRRLGIEAATLGRWSGLPFDAGILVLLARLSGRLFPGRGGLVGVPVAMLGWALHEDARLFASGGLETPAFTFFLLLGFDLGCVGERPGKEARAAWALAMATLLRPEGLLYSGLLGVFLAWRSRFDRRVVLVYAATWAALVAPHLVFRLLYYGYPFPNPYYAKSGGGTNWAQGWTYAGLYFGAYRVLGLALLGVVLLGVHRRRREPGAAALLAAASATALTILYVIRVGGDFMFARFFLPTTPFLLLLAESVVQRLPRLAPRLVATALLGALVVVGAVRKHSWLSPRRGVRGIVDEVQFYPKSRLDEIRELSRPLRDCLAGTRATLMVQGGQASLAYYARFPVAIERYGLTDETIAHGPLLGRARPGHEKVASAEYVYQRRVNFRINYAQVRNAPVYTLFSIPGVNGEILVYDRELMEHLKRCTGARFYDFPRWLEQAYVPSIPEQALPRLQRDWDHFQLFYFQHNPDPEGLRDKLRAALAARGLTNLVENPRPPAAILPDLGRPSGTP